MPQQAHAPPLPNASPGDKARIAAALAEARERTWLLVDAIPEEDLRRPALPILSPPVWDLGHIGNFEELWLVQELGHQGELHPGYNDTYNAILHPRAERPKLKLLDRAGARAYMDEVRQQSLTILPTIDTGAGAPRLTRHGFVYWMLVLHEHQHQETLLQTINALGPDRYRPARARPLPPPRPGRPAAGWVHVPAGPFEMGIPHGPGVYDNEAPAHRVDVGAFDMARYPVTCGEYLEFVEAGGYEEDTHWSPEGRGWLAEEPHHAPMNWFHENGIWHRRLPSGNQPISDVADEILVHVTAHEADAYAHWRGCRLPTEQEWEKAARWNPATGGVIGRNPWGDEPADTARANVDHLGWGPSRVGACPQGAAPCRAEHLIGDVWEWTSSTFQAYPGYQTFPYPEYSEVFFGDDYRVLRGGSWATRASCANGTFRNWDLPIRRQIFAGVRLARDPTP